LPLPILAEPTEVVELFSAPVLVFPLPAGAYMKLSGSSSLSSTSFFLLS